MHVSSRGLRRALALVTLVAALLAGTAQAAAAQEPDCQNDAKSLGRIQLSTADTPGTWWHLTRSGFDAAGITDYEAAIEAAFGVDFADLDQAVAALVDGVRFIDRNGNDYVCASSLRGTRSVVGDPNYAYYYFSVSDDKHA